jgi:KUP system potassium uptake protein
MAAAYGVAVTTDMVFTTILFAVVARTRWQWGLPAVFAMASAFLFVDLGFWGASLLKIPAGGWFPLVVAAGVFTIMTTWNTGRAILNERIGERSASVEKFIEGIVAAPPLRVAGTALYLARDPAIAPHALVQNLKHNKVLHERVVILAMHTITTARVEESHRVQVEPLEANVFRVIARHGFAEDPEVPPVLERLAGQGLAIDPSETTFFLGRETLLATKRPGMAIWREKLFAILSRNARRATKYFCLPSDRVMELGAEIEL